MTRGHTPAQRSLVAEVLGTKIHTRDPDEMQAVIIGKLVDRYAAEQGIEVESAEIGAYLDRLRRVAGQDRWRQEARCEELARKLEAKTLSDAERQSLSSELDQLNEFLSNIGEARNGARFFAIAAQARTTMIRRPWGLDSSWLVVRSRIGGCPARRSKITSQPLSSLSPAR